MLAFVYQSSIILLIILSNHLGQTGLEHYSLKSYYRGLKKYILENSLTLKI